MNAESAAIIAGITEHVESIRPEPTYDLTAWERNAARELSRGSYLPDVASALVSGYAAQIAEIQADGDLTLEAKTRRANAIRDEANAITSVFENAYTEATGAEIQSLQLSLRRPDTGLSGSRQFEADLSYRDALDRCSKLDGKPRELKELYLRAQKSGDTMLQRAAFGVALDMNFNAGSEVVEMWLRDHPKDAEKLTRLRALERDRDDLDAKTARAGRFRKL